MALDDERKDEQPAAEIPTTEDNSTESATQTPKAPRKRRKVPGRELTDDQIAERDRVSALLQERYTELENAIEAYNGAIEDLKTPVTEALDAFNEALSDARVLRDEIVSDADEYIEERTERWQESDAGQAVQAYKHEWEYAEIDEVEVEFPEQIEAADRDAEILENLPEEAEE